MTGERAIIQQAAEWFATLRDEQASADDHQRWQCWLAAHPDHARIWRRVEAINQPFTHLAAPPFTDTAQRVLARDRNTGRRRTLQLLGIGGMFLGTGLLLRYTLPWQSWTHSYAVARAAQRTTIGEQRQLTLDDSTTLAINTASAVDVDYSRNLRRIVLHEGEILIESAPDKQSPPRPLVIDTRFGRLTALGTRFNVRGDSQRVELAVFHGAVRIQPASGGAHVDIPAGQQASFTAEQIDPEGHADPARELWSRGQLIADNIPLAGFISELGRYTPIRLQIDDATGQQRLLGVYRISDPSRDVPRILASLESALPVRLQINNDQSVQISGR